jgi:hypothetical protein
MAESYTDLLRGHERSGCGLETISFTTIVKEAESKRHGMCSVCMTDQERESEYIYISVNSSSVQHVCARTALTDSSGNKKELQGTIIIHRKFIHT